MVIEDNKSCTKISSRFRRRGRCQKSILHLAPPFHSHCSGPSATVRQRPNFGPWSCWTGWSPAKAPELQVTRIWTLAIWTSQDNSPCRVFFQTQQVNWMIFFFGFSGSAMLVCLLFWFIWNQESRISFWVLFAYVDKEFQDHVDHVFLVQWLVN